MNLLAASIFIYVTGMYAEPVQSLPWCTVELNYARVPRPPAYQGPIGDDDESDPSSSSSWPNPSEPPPELDLPADTIERVRVRANQLFRLGVASCPLGTWEDLPGSITYDEVPICRDDGIIDGYATSAFVPREEPPQKFYLRMAGGISGQSCVAGPYFFQKPIFLGGEDAGTAVLIERNATVSILLVGTLPDALWEVDPAGLPRPDSGNPYAWIHAETYDERPYQIFSFTWGNLASDAQKKHVFSPRFIYKQGNTTIKSFFVTLEIR